jgi:hypothetical protein
MKKQYVLEVVRFIIEKDGPDGWLKRGGKYEHIGYMHAKFKTKEDACLYYDQYNPHMRKLNAYNTYQSDCDPQTNLIYIVRRDYHLINTISPFSEQNKN